MTSHLLQDTITPLDDYVNRDDGMFSWYIHDEIQYQNVRVLLVNMTSQRWLNGTRTLIYCAAVFAYTYMYVVLPSCHLT